MTPSAAPVPRRTSKAAVASLALGVLSCFCVPALPAVILGLIGLYVTRKDPTLRGRGLANSGLALGVVFGAISVCTIIAWPDFARQQERNHQNECKLTLKALAASERDLQAYADEPLRKDIEHHRWYRFLLTPKDLDALDGGERAALPAWLPARLGVTGACPRCDYTFACIGDLDDDPNFDVWAISSAPLEGRWGFADAGEPRPIQLVDDQEK